MPKGASAPVVEVSACRDNASALCGGKVLKVRAAVDEQVEGLPCRISGSVRVGAAMRSEQSLSMSG
jgi:hypothetical protein